MIWIIYSDHVYQEKAPSTEFIEKIKKEYHWNLEIKNYSLFELIEDGNNVSIFYNNEIVNRYPDMILLRVNKVLSKLKFIKHFEQLGIKVVNSSEAIKKASDKILYKCIII